jgi:putative tryptophan/tyrosine transport system substrate-binding protein
MRPRDFISLPGCAASIWPLGARAQQQARPAIGFLHGTSLETRRAEVVTLSCGLTETGYVEG